MATIVVPDAYEVHKLAQRKELLAPLCDKLCGVVPTLQIDAFCAALTEHKAYVVNVYDIECALTINSPRILLMCQMSSLASFITALREAGVRQLFTRGRMCASANGMFEECVISMDQTVVILPKFYDRYDGHPSMLARMVAATWGEQRTPRDQTSFNGLNIDGPYSRSSNIYVWCHQSDKREDTIFDEGEGSDSFDISHKSLATSTHIATNNLLAFTYTTRSLIESVSCNDPYLLKMFYGYVDPDVEEDIDASPNPTEKEVDDALVTFLHATEPGLCERFGVQLKLNIISTVPETFESSDLSSFIVSGVQHLFRNEYDAQAYGNVGVGFHILCRVSDAMCDFIDIPHGNMLPRTSVTCVIVGYVKQHGLTNGKNITPDQALQKLLNVPDTIQLTYFNLQKYLKVHFLDLSTIRDQTPV